MTEPGAQKLILCPLVPEGLNHVKVTMESLSGPIQSEWQRNKDELIYTVEIPQNLETEVRILRKYGNISTILKETAFRGRVL